VVSVRGYIFNLYTEPDHRNHGLAHRLGEAAIALCQDLGLEIVEIHASLEAERGVRSFGFQPTSEHRLVLSSGLHVPKQWINRRA
jgi:GNAT superfamily N-acetyltransferase